MDAEEFEKSMEPLRQLFALRDRFKRQCETSQKIGSALTDRVSMEMSIMEIAICFGLLDKALEGL